MSNAPSPPRSNPVAGGFLDDPLKGWGNDDLLLTDEQRNFVAQRYPAAFRVLDWPELRTAFEQADKRANASRRSTRAAGVYLVLMAYLGLALAAASAILPNIRMFMLQLDVAAATLGALLTVCASLLGLRVALAGSRKKNWVANRFWTERLRQLYFQFLINNFDLASEAMRADDRLAEYRRIRHRDLTAMLDELERATPLAIEQMSADLAEASPWLRRQWVEESDVGPAKSPEADALFDALERQRIGVQVRYVETKMMKGVSSPEWRATVIRWWSNVLTGVVLLLTVLVGVSAVVLNSAVAPPVLLLLFASTCVSGLVVALRALDEGLQITADFDRYAWYRVAVLSIKRQFEDAQGRRSKLLLLRELERISYQELRRFLMSVVAARFVF